MLTVQDVYLHCRPKLPCCDGRQSGGASDTISTAAATELAEVIKALPEEKVPVDCDADVGELRAKVTFGLCVVPHATRATGRRSNTTACMGDEVLDAMCSVTCPASYSDTADIIRSMLAHSGISLHSMLYASLPSKSRSKAWSPRYLASSKSPRTWRK